jgi:hypothetical protein
MHEMNQWKKRPKKEQKRDENEKEKRERARREHWSANRARSHGTSPTKHIHHLDEEADEN